MPEVVFVLARGQNVFFAELACALAYELHELGAAASVVTGELPEPRPDRVHVLLPVHEFMTLSGYAPPASLLARCILICAEQPTSPFFARNIAVTHAAGAVFDINRGAVRAHRARGVAAQPLQLGYTAAWDRHDETPPREDPREPGAPNGRDIDILFMGRLTHRRECALALYADTLERFRCHLLLGDDSAPNLLSGPDFAAGEDKLALLARSKVLINVHGEDEPYFEWLRVAEAICCGCAVVSEHSADVDPLRCGEHLLTGRLETVALLAAALVEDPVGRQQLVEAAYDHLREQVPLRAAAQALLAAAVRIEAQAPFRPALRLAARVGHALLTTADPSPGPRQPLSLPRLSTGHARTLRACKGLHLALLELRRERAREAIAQARPEDPIPRVQAVLQTPGWGQADPATVSIVVPLYNHAAVLAEALESLQHSTRTDWEVVIVDDGSSDDSAAVARQWLEANSGRRGLLVCSEVNRGLSRTRNTGASFARCDLLLMLDADNLLRRFAIERLTGALRRDPDASFAYGILDRFSADGPEGLLSVFGWDPQRLRSGNYIDALALVRRAALQSVGGYSEDPRLALGWEDYDLWARMAEHGHRAAFVREIVARYRVGHSSMVSVTDISRADAFAAVAEHAPRLMRRLRIPA